MRISTYSNWLVCGEGGREGGEVGFSSAKLSDREICNFNDLKKICTGFDHKLFKKIQCKL